MNLIYLELSKVKHIMQHFRDNFHGTLRLMARDGIDSVDHIVEALEIIENET